MAEGEGRFRVGQEIEVTFRARVDTIGSISTGGMDPHLLVSASLFGNNGDEGKTWIDPDEAQTLRVVRQVLPTKSGMYTKHTGGIPFDDEFHTDGKEFYYLNSLGKWCDVGWGMPVDGDADLLELLSPPPF